MNIATHTLRIPDSKLALEVTEIVRDKDTLLFNEAPSPSCSSIIRAEFTYSPRSPASTAA